MAIWLVRAGKFGEHEAKFLSEGRVYCTWDNLNTDLEPVSTPIDLKTVLAETYPEVKPKTITHWSGQVWAFSKKIQPGDWVVVPLKGQGTVVIGEVTGAYEFSPEAESPYYHYRTIKWLGDPVPKSYFGQDLLFTFGAFMTICRIQTNDAEQRIRAMWNGGLWSQDKNLHPSSPSAGSEAAEDTGTETDLEDAAQSQIIQLIEAKFTSHNLTRLVDAILRAQGYVTYVSPPGADGGVDILAGSGPLGFDAPRLCVEVKSGAAPIDRPTVDKLIGAMTKFNAEKCLFVSWSGFKSTVPKELAQSFFRVRLWSKKELLDALFEHYERLDPEIRAELPLKQIWTVAVGEE